MDHHRTPYSGPAAEQQPQQRHPPQPPPQRAALHASAAAAAVAALPNEQLQNFPAAMMPQLGNTGGRMNSNPINMRQDATSLSNFMGNNNNNRTEAESAAAIQSMLLSSANLSTSPNSLPYLRQFEPMNQNSSTTSELLHQEQLEQAELLARYQQQRLLLNQQQQHQLRNRQQMQMQMQMQLEPRLNNPSARFHGAGAQLGHASNNFQDMMLFQQQQQQQQQHQHQQQMRGDDTLFNSNAFASLTGYGSGASPTTNLARSQQQQRLQQQSGIFQQQLSTSNPQQHQQQFMMNDSLFADPIEQLYQQQLQIEQQLRRRSSLSSGVASISPLMGSLEHQPTQQQQMTAAEARLTTNNPQLFGTGMAGAMTDFPRFSNAGPLLQQQSMFTSLANQPQFNNNVQNIGNRPPTMLSSSALRNRDDIAVAPHHSTEFESARRGEKKKRSRTFPEKLMAAMIEHEDERAVAWLPDGKSFVIVNPDLFVNEVLQGDFKQAKYASFVRKLHRWGFTRLTSGTGTDCFHHPQFNRNFPDWSSRVTCVPMKEAAAREAPANVGRISAVAAVKSRPTKTTATKEVDVAHETEGIVDKQPSLAGVERFIRRHSKTLDTDTTMNFDASSALPEENVTDPHISSKQIDATAGRRLELPIQPIENPTNDDQPP